MGVIVTQHAEMILQQLLRRSLQYSGTHGLIFEIIMGQFVSKGQFAESTGLSKLGLRVAAGPLMQISGHSKLNKMLSELEHQQGVEFIDSLLQKQGLEIDISGKGWDQIPAEGAFITVSNHPFGMWDCLALLKVLLEKRPDVKLMGNFLLDSILPLQDSFHLIAPTSSQKGWQENREEIQEAFTHLKEGKPLALFPAGEVSTLQKRRISDRLWQSSAIKFIQAAEVPVIPIYFEGSNSVIFHLLGLIHPRLRKAAIPSENLKRKNSQIKIRIGSPISSKELQDIKDTNRMGRYLRARTYALGSGLKVNSFFRNTIGRATEAQPLAQEQDHALQLNDIHQLAPSQLIEQQREFDLYLANAEQIPNILPEIGRLRELTFRSVGEGSLYERDLDEFDLYYQHLFLWDREAEKIVGAYRIGFGDDIIHRYGKKGFYTHTLFKMKPEFEKVLAKGLELGRSFVIPEYQRKRLPLFLLWKGLHQVATNHPDYCYLFGPVSISNDYTRLSRELIVAMIRQFFWDGELAKLVKARKQFRLRSKRVSVEDLLNGTGDSLRKLDHLIEELEPKHTRLPVLLKKYIKQQARIISFNVDPKFSNCLDGLIIMDLKELPSETHKMMGRA